MSTFWEIVQWVFASCGLGSVIVNYFLAGRIKKQELKFNELKSKFDILLNKRTKAISALNYRLSNIEIWLRETSRLDDWEWIDVEEFKQLVSKFEIILIHAHILLPTETHTSLNVLLEEFRNCIELYNEECEKSSKMSVSLPPKITFINRLFDKKTKELMKSAKWRLHQNISEEN